MFCIKTNISETTLSYIDTTSINHSKNYLSTIWKNTSHTDSKTTIKLINTTSETLNRIYTSITIPEEVLTNITTKMIPFIIISKINILTEPFVITENISIINIDNSTTSLSNSSFDWHIKVFLFIIEIICFYYNRYSYNPIVIYFICIL